MKSFVAGLAVLTMAALAGQGAMAAGYRLRVLAPLPAAQTSLAHVLTPTGGVLGESTVTQRCPLSQWVACLVYGYNDRQPRATYWSDRPDATQPLTLRCLDTRLAAIATWDMPCEALGANSRGVMVGRSYVGMGAEGAHRPVLWRGPTSPAVDLSPRLEDLPPHDSARAVAINEEGVILGRARIKDTSSEYAFLLHGGVPQLLPSAGAIAIRPVAINGTMAIGEGRFDGDGQSGVIVWQLNGVTSTVRGITGLADHVYASGLSSAGHITGAYWAPLEGHATQAYIWYQGRGAPLQTDPGHDSRGHSVNAAGQVVGTQCAAGEDIRGCRASLWTHGIRQDLNLLAPPPAGHVFVDARAINDRGQIIGWMRGPGGQMQGFLLTPSP